MPHKVKKISRDFTFKRWDLMQVQLQGNFVWHHLYFWNVGFLQEISLKAGELVIIIKISHFLQSNDQKDFWLQIALKKVKERGKLWSRSI